MNLNLNTSWGGVRYPGCRYDSSFFTSILGPFCDRTDPILLHKAGIAIVQFNGGCHS